jgi:putative polymerase
VLIVLADSRFGAYLCILAFVLMLCPLGLATAGVVVLPAVALVVLIVVPVVVTGSYDPQNRYVDNGFVGRFVLAAQILGDFDVWTWLGLRAARMQTFDSGYAYTISGIGVIGLAALWGILFATEGADRQYYTLRNLMALYYGTILCVSNSPYTIKTASLTWFLIGAAAAIKPRRPMRKSVDREQAVSAGAVPVPFHGKVRFKERAG